MPEQEQQMTAGPAAGAGGEGRRAHVPDGLILALACVAQFMVVLDVSIVNVALPSIGRDLHYSATGLQWVVNAYVLTFAGLPAARRTRRRPVRPSPRLPVRAGPVHRWPAWPAACAQTSAG